MKFKKNRELQLWECRTELAEYVIELDICTNSYVLLINNRVYSVNKTLKTCKKDASDYETLEKYFRNKNKKC